MSRTPILTLGIAMLLGIALTATGCGGGGESKSASTTEASATTEEAATPHAATETEPAETEPAEVPDLSAFATSENCRELVTVAAKLAQAFTGTGPSDVEEGAAFFSEVADQAPDEIREDFQVVAEVYRKIAKALEGVDVSSGAAPSAEVIQRLQELSAEINDAEVTEATSNINAWAQENCAGG